MNRTQRYALNILLRGKAMKNLTCRKRLSILAPLFLVPLLLPFQSGLCAGEIPANPEQPAAQTKLNLNIVEGIGAINNIRQRVAREVIVQVTDENDRPVGGVSIAFALQQPGGAGGTFSNGQSTFQVSTNSAGQASATYTPNAIAGAFQIGVTAAFQGIVATAAIPQTNAVGAAAAGAGGAGVSPNIGAGASTGGISATTVAVVAVAAAAAVVAVAVAVKEGSNGDEPAARRTIRIGQVGTPNVDPPGGWQKSELRRERPKWRQ
jgi:hypothetical protein